MRKIIFQGKYLTMSTEEIKGHLYERVTMRSGIRVLPINNDNKILFIKEYRQHEKSAQWKLIGGWVDKEKLTPLEIAKEELREEVSLKAGKWKLFYEYKIPNGTIEEDVYYYIAEDLQQLSLQENPDSDIVEEIVFLNEKELKEKLFKKEIIWDKDVTVALMLFEEMKNKNK